MIQAGLYSLLASDPGFSALIQGRIFEVAGPPDMKYYLGNGCATYALVGGSAQPTLRTSGTIRQRVELNGLANTYEAAAAIRDVIIKVVNGWQARLSDGTNILNAVLLNPGTDFVTEDRIFRCMVEFYILYTLPA